MAEDNFNKDEYAERTKVDLPARLTFTNGQSKPAGDRITNLHDWLEFPDPELNTSYLTGGMSGVLFASGDFSDKYMTETQLGATVYSLNQEIVDNGLYLLAGPAVVAPSGRQGGFDYRGLTKNQINNFTEQDSILKHSGVYPHYEGGEQELPESTVNSAFSNAAETRLEARKLGLYKASVFNPYIHYQDQESDAGPVRKIDYKDKFQAASKYLDPYSDLYIFQTSTSFNPQDSDTEVVEAPPFVGDVNVGPGIENIA